MLPLRKSLKIAVRDLVAHVLRRGDLAFGFLSSIRPVDAIRIHQKIQQSRPKNYTAEVAVSHQINNELFTLTVGGRIDGVYLEPDRALVEEITVQSEPNVDSDGDGIPDGTEDGNANGWIDGDAAMFEVLTSIKRAGADMILTYFADEVAEALAH